MTAVTEKMVEDGAKAAYEHWNNYPACIASDPWEVRCEKLPGSAKFFRDISRISITAALSTDVGEDATPTPSDSSGGSGDKIIQGLHEAIDYAKAQPAAGSGGEDAPVTVSFPAHEIAHNLLLAHTGMEGGCPRIDWYKLRREISAVIAEIEGKHRSQIADMADHFRAVNVGRVIEQLGLVAAQPPATDGEMDLHALAARYQRLHRVCSRILWTDIGKPAVDNKQTSEALEELAEIMLMDALIRASADASERSTDE